MLFWLAVINGLAFSAPATIIVPLLDNLLPGVVWWPGVWMAVLAFSGLALIAWR